MAYPHETDDAGVVTKKNVNADNQAGEPVESQAVTGRPNDVAPENSTLSSRRAERLAAEKPAAKAVDSGRAQNKAVESGSRKARQ